MYRQITLFCIALMLTGCSSTGISVQNQYFSREDLASHIIGTPDPERNCPPIGQRLIIQWKYPHDAVETANMQLVLTVRLRDYTEERLIIPINNSRGTYLYELRNQRYFDSCGIATYKIETWACGRLVDVWRHQLWTDLITIDQQNDDDVFEYDPESINFLDE
jgi:hypothetical protein